MNDFPLPIYKKKNTHTHTQVSNLGMNSIDALDFFVTLVCVDLTNGLFDSGLGRVKFGSLKFCSGSVRITFGLG